MQHPIVLVMPGLGPGIHVLRSETITDKDVDGRDNGVPADKVGGVPRPGHDGYAAINLQNKPGSIVPPDNAWLINTRPRTRLRAPKPS
jgi:hypothetical protein